MIGAGALAVAVVISMVVLPPLPHPAMAHGEAPEDERVRESEPIYSEV